MSKVVIIGAGQAGSEAATHLRSQDFVDGITFIRSENVLPYQRPLLSKKYGLGEAGELLNKSQLLLLEIDLKDLLKQ
tara:strand:+ start:344 stop:574 length:231 start_codon:yes stop_codon:yes gene_type:complete